MLYFIKWRCNKNRMSELLRQVCSLCINPQSKSNLWPNGNVGRQAYNYCAKIILTTLFPVPSFNTTEKILWVGMRHHMTGSLNLCFVELSNISHGHYLIVCLNSILIHLWTGRIRRKCWVGLYVNSLRTTTVDTDGNITKRQLLRNRNVALLQDMSQDVMWPFCPFWSPLSQ